MEPGEHRAADRQVQPSPTGQLVFISGQVGNLPTGEIFDDPYLQAEQIFANFTALSSELAAGADRIVRPLTFVAGSENLPAFYQARDATYARWFPDGVYPGHSLAVVSAPADPRLRFEIEGYVRLTTG
ncbi:RidA family protein [Kribbella antibiotica]|uniref:RidA family protein n=1 Tax=Kribbella antibiotica TaxID=190195 RepID=UPI0014045D04|nr:RidA family protein [Kribbella antibiotica]